MFDIEVPGCAGAGDLRRIGETLGTAGVGLEGGGMWAGTARYLVADGARARTALAKAGIVDVTVRVAILAELDADVPGALGRMMAAVEAAGVPLIAQYSDHDNRKVLVTDDPEGARAALR